MSLSYFIAREKTKIEYSLNGFLKKNVKVFLKVAKLKQVTWACLISTCRLYAEMQEGMCLVIVSIQV